MKASPLDHIKTFVNMRNARERMLIIAFALIFLLFLDVVLWLLPVTRSLVESIPSLTTLASELEGLKNDQNNRDLIKKKSETTIKELADDEDRLGASSQLSSLLENLSAMALESGIKITSLKPIETTTPETGKLYVAVPIQIDATAGFHQLGAFLERLETGKTFFKITDIKVTASTTTDRKHSVEMMLETYRKT